MAQEPITIFAPPADPEALRRFLLERDPEAVVEAAGDTWASITVTFDAAGEPRSLTFLHDRDYYAGPGWAAQRDGMWNYLSRFPLGDRAGRVRELVGSFGFALGTRFDPEFDPDGDDRLAALFEVTQFLDGVLFTPSSLRDADGQLIASADGEADEDVTWPGERGV